MEVDAAAILGPAIRGAGGGIACGRKAHPSKRREVAAATRLGLGCAAQPQHHRRVAQAPHSHTCRLLNRCQMASLVSVIQGDESALDPLLHSELRAEGGRDGLEGRVAIVHVVAGARAGDAAAAATAGAFGSDSVIIDQNAPVERCLLARRDELARRCRRRRRHGGRVG